MGSMSRGLHNETHWSITFPATSKHLSETSAILDAAFGNPSESTSTIACPTQALNLRTHHANQNTSAQETNSRMETSSNEGVHVYWWTWERASKATSLASSLDGSDRAASEIELRQPIKSDTELSHRPGSDWLKSRKKKRKRKKRLQIP